MVRLSKVPFPIGIAGDCIGIPGKDRVMRVILFSYASKPNPFGVTATESGRSPAVSMRYLLDQRCSLGITYPAINVVS